MANKSKQKSPLISLTPTEFENLTFDLMVARGMRNVSWRTPGADGGRDIEGIVLQSDFALTNISTKWFVECKRYKSSVDWPTVYAKIGYADSNKADALLMCTSSKFTPAAITEAEKWNSNKRGPTVRLWPGHQIEACLQQHPDIAMKYGILDSPKTPTGSVLQLALALSKSVGTYYSKTIFDDLQPDLMLEAAHAFAQLLQKRMEDIDREQRFRPAFFDANKFQIQNCEVAHGKYNIDEPALAAFIAYLVALQRVELKLSTASLGTCLISATEDISPIIDRYRSVFDAIALWGDFEYKIQKENVLVSQRK